MNRRDAGHWPIIVTLMVLTLAAWLLTGCASDGGLKPGTPFTKGGDEVRFDRVEVALALGDMQALVAVLEAKATERCSDQVSPARRFSASSCQTIQQAIDQAAALKQTIVTALRNPKVEIDWQEIAKVVKLLVQIAMKFA